MADTATVRGHGWATAEGWDYYRATITDLYLNQNKRLKDVKVIMEREYHFFATDKMYKSNFKKWDIRKNNKHEGSSSGKQSKDKSHKSSSNTTNQPEASGSSSRHT